MAKGKELHHLEIHPSENGGHAVHHIYKMKQGKSAAFMEREEPEVHTFGPEQHGEMMAHVANHLGIEHEQPEHEEAEE